MDTTEQLRPHLARSLLVKLFKNSLWIKFYRTWAHWNFFNMFFAKSMTTRNEAFRIFQNVKAQFTLELFFLIIRQTTLIYWIAHFKFWNSKYSQENNFSRNILLSISEPNNMPSFLQIENNVQKTNTFDCVTKYKYGNLGLKHG